MPNGTNVMNHPHQLNAPKLLEAGDEYLQTPSIPTATRRADIITYAVWLYYLSLANFNFKPQPRVATSHDNVRSMDCKSDNPAHNIFVRFQNKGQANLLGNAGTAISWIAPFHRNDGINDFSGRPL